MSLEAAIQANTTAVQQLADLIAFQIKSAAAQPTDQSIAKELNAKLEASHVATPDPDPEPVAATEPAPEKVLTYQETAEIVTAYAKKHGTPATRVKLSELAGVETLTKAKPEDYAAIVAGLQE